jgi:RNA polymerase sigma-70 factor, ECF subfamily
MALDPTEFVQLLAAARAGDAAAIDRLFGSFRPYLRRLARALVPNILHPKGSGSDVVQDALFAASRHFGAFRGSTEVEFRTWLESILRNEAADFRRRFLGTDKRRATAEVHLAEEDPESGVELADTRLSPRSQLIDREKQERIRQVLDELPPELRQIVQWRIEENFTFAEIGRRLGCTESQARHRFGKAVRLLAGRLGDLQ